MNDLLISKFKKMKNLSVTIAIFYVWKKGEMTAYRKFAATLFPRSLIMPTIARNTIRIHNWKVDLNF